MPLPEDFKERLLEKLAAHKIRPQGEICGENDWNVIIDRAVSSLLTDLFGASRIPHEYAPCAGLICGNCGNLRLFAPDPLGLIPGQEGD